MVTRSLLLESSGSTGSVNGGSVVTESYLTGTVRLSEPTVAIVPSASSHVEKDVLEWKIQRVLEMDASQPSAIAVLDGVLDPIQGAMLMDIRCLAKIDEEIPVPGFSVFDGNIRDKTGDLIICLTDGKIVATVLGRMAHQSQARSQVELP